MGSLRQLKQSMAKGSGNPWVKFIPKNGSMNVRFIQEPEDWVNYVEHYDVTLHRSFPCNGETSCPGCMGGERKSSRYLTNAVDRDNNDRVIPLQLPKDLANRLVIRYERNGSITDRDFELSRSGEGLDTVYDLDAGVQDRENVSRFQPHDLLKVLQGAYDDVFGTGSSNGHVDEDDQPEVVKAPRKRPGPKPRTSPDPEKTATAEAGTAKKSTSKSAAVKKATRKKAAAAPPEPEFTPDVDDDEDTQPDDEAVDYQDQQDEVQPDQDDNAAEDDTADDGDDDGDDDEGYTLEELQAMPLGALRGVARNEFGVATKGLGQKQLIDAIFAAGEETGDEVPF